MGTPHNSASKGDIAKVVLMPGDPLRAKYIASEFLSEAELFNEVRGMYGYTGTYKGKKLWEKLNVKANNRKITEVIKEIDQSKYIGETNLLQEYQLPTIEVIYIVE